jgi:hypothetical protein
MSGRFIRSCAVGAAVVSVAAATASAAAQGTALVPGSAKVAGRYYGQWVVAAFRWRLLQPNITSNGNACISAGQRGAVWFLGGSSTNASVATRQCSIPAGRYVMLFTPSVDCSTAEPTPFHASTNVGLMRCAKRQWQRLFNGESVTLDGALLHPPAYVGRTVPFAFRMPAHNNYLRAPGRTHGRMAIYGDATILRPLRPGTHTLVVYEGWKPSIYVKTTYQLTIG